MGRSSQYENNNLKKSNNFKLFFKMVIHNLPNNVNYI